MQVPAVVIPNLGGDGSDGDFFPTTDVVIDTDVQSMYQFHDVYIPEGVTVTVIGSKPLVIKVVDAFYLYGVIEASGQPGDDSGDVHWGGVGGVGGPGGHKGGDGGVTSANPFHWDGWDGTGPAPGLKGEAPPMVPPPTGEPVGGGGGGGNFVPGEKGKLANSGQLPDRSGLGGSAMPATFGGSGGGGGAAYVENMVLPTADGGGGGGGGGGWIRITAKGSVIIGDTGCIFAKGGDGGNSYGGGGAGGGGAGGRVILSAVRRVEVYGELDAMGGTGGLATISWCGACPGGDGGEGMVYLYGDTVMPFGTIAPAPDIRGITVELDKDNYTRAEFEIQIQPSHTYLAVFSLDLLSTPLNFAPQPFWIDPFDPLFQALYPVNTLPAFFSGLQGSSDGTVVVDIQPLLSGPPLEEAVYMQVVTNLWGNYAVSELFEICVLVH